MKFILHIGTEKTGTSTIQSILKQDAQRLLKEHATWIPNAFRNKGKSDNQIMLPALFCEIEGSGNLRDEVSRENETDEGACLDERVKQAFVQELEQAKKQGAERVLVSSEHLSSRLRTQSELTKLKSWLETFGQVEKIIVYLRRQDEFLLSTFSTEVKSGRVLPFAIPNERWAKQRYDYQILITRWAGVFGQSALTVKVFEKQQFVKSSLLRDFYMCLGMAVDERLLKKANLQKNPALGVESIALMGAFNQWAADKDVAWSRIVRRRFVSYLEDNVLSSPMTLSKRDAKLFLGRYEESNRWVAKKFFGRDNLFMEKMDYSSQGCLPDSNMAMKLMFAMLTDFLMQLYGEVDEKKISKSGMLRMFS